MEKLDSLIAILVIAIVLVVGISFSITPEIGETEPEPNRSSGAAGNLNPPPESMIGPRDAEELRLPERGGNSGPGMSPDLFPAAASALEDSPPPEPEGGFDPMAPAVLFPVEAFRPPQNEDPAATAGIVDPSDIWFTAFTLLQEGEAAMKNGQSVEGLSKLKRSKALFDRLAEKYPKFHPELLRFRQDYLAALIER